jgi:hypothetical protein
MDRRGRELERRWQETGDWSDMEAFMAHLRRSDPREWLKAEVLHAAKAATTIKPTDWGGTWISYGTWSDPSEIAAALTERVKVAWHEVVGGSHGWRPVPSASKGGERRRVGETVVVIRGPHRGRVDRLSARAGTHRFGVGHRPKIRRGLRIAELVDKLVRVGVQQETVGAPFVAIYGYQALNLPRGVFELDELPIFLE